MKNFIKEYWLLALVIIITAFAATAIITGSIQNEEAKAQIINGYVVDKVYRTEYISYNTIRVGKNYTRIPQHHAAFYQMIIAAEEDSTIQALYTVSEETYNSYKIGDYIENVNQTILK